MARLSEHPTVKRYREKQSAPVVTALSKAELRELCREAGADDVGFVEIDHAEIADQRAEILSHFPYTRTLISLVVRMNRENIRRPARSVANVEFHHATHEVDDIARSIVSALEARGVRAANGAAAGFPMEADRWGYGKMWIVSHKPIAVAAGVGQMGIHRNIIHPVFGNFISLGTVLIDAVVDEPTVPIDYNPCLECKLCVAACPTGAISPNGEFNFSACYTHNYREFMGGFTDWIETVADSSSAKEYRKKFSDAESVSMWQSLSFGANYKAAYCMAVCPAGEDVIGPFLENRKQFVADVVRPLRDKSETIYVLPDTQAEAHVARHFPNKRVKRVSNGLAAQRTIRGFLRGLTIVFEPKRAEGLDATYHFTFTGAEEVEATVVIRDEKITVEQGHIGSPNLRVTADSETWLKFLAKETSLPWSLVRRKLQIKGSPRLLVAFGRCFP